MRSESLRHFKVKVQLIDIYGRLGVLKVIEESNIPCCTSKVQCRLKEIVWSSVHLNDVKIELDGPGARAEVERGSGVGRDNVRRYKRSSG